MLQLLTRFAATCDSPDFFLLKPWHYYLPKDEFCGVNLHLQHASEWPRLWLIGLVVLEDLLRIAGMVAVVFIIIGGVKYITSRGEPDNTRDALHTIINALIGLVIAIMASAVVGFIGSKLGG